MDSENNIFEKLGGRKFILSVVIASAIVALAALAPGSLTAEVVIGLLGVIAAYSGSNAVLTGLAMRGQKTNGTNVADIAEGAEGQPETLPRDNYESLSVELVNLEARVSQNERTTAEIIEIIKQIMQKKT